MNKRKYLLILLAAALLLCLLTGCADTEKNEAVSGPIAFWQSIYGEDMVMELPGREDAYALLYGDIQGETWWGDQAVTFMTLHPVKTTLWDEAYSGSEYSLSPQTDTFRPGETLKFTAVNSSGSPLEFSGAFLLETEIDGAWYPVLSPKRPPVRTGSIEPGESVHELGPGHISAEIGLITEYNETEKLYEFIPAGDIRLSPGKYRYLLPCTADGESIKLACEFNIG